MSKDSDTSLNDRVRRFGEVCKSSARALDGLVAIWSVVDWSVIGRFGYAVVEQLVGLVGGSEI